MLRVVLHLKGSTMKAICGFFPLICSKVNYLNILLLLNELPELLSLPLSLLREREKDVNINNNK